VSDGDAPVPDGGVNLYAPPRAQVEPVEQSGQVWRSGGLVRMDLGGRLPDRCVVCNAPAGGDRLTRTLYWSSPAFWVATLSAPFALLGLGAFTGYSIFLIAFWPVLLALVIAYLIVRKKVEIDCGICRRHRLLRAVLGGSSFALAVIMAGLLVTSAGSQNPAFAFAAMLVGFALLVLGVVHGVTGVNAVRIRGVDRSHVWLAGTGEKFRSALLEAPAEREG